MSGTIVVAAISRYASALDGLARKLVSDPTFVRIRDQDLLDGQHRNEANHPDYFTTAYFRRPEDLQAKFEQAGFRDVQVLGVEGPGWILSDFEARWTERALRHDIMAMARALESERSILGVSAHLLAVGRKPQNKAVQHRMEPARQPFVCDHVAAARGSFGTLAGNLTNDRIDPGKLGTI